MQRDVGLDADALHVVTRCGNEAFQPGAGFGDVVEDVALHPVVAPGEKLVLAPSGKHVMVFDLPEDLKPGASVEATLTFADGDKLSAPLAVVAPGGAN